MSKRALLIGTSAYLLLTLVAIPLYFGIPLPLFTSDDAAYSGAAINLLQRGTLSLDGVHPFLEREPGQSLLLAITYAIFGIENPIGVFIVQGALLLVIAGWFCRGIQQRFDAPTAMICFVLILSSGSILHTVFSAYRECLALVLMMGCATLWMRNADARVSLQYWYDVALGVILGLAILTYYSFVLLPIVLAGLMLIERQRSFRSAALMLVGAYAIVGLWGVRNLQQDGHFRIIENRRADAMWYVRGEQAVTVNGLEPLRCLWSEYISRDWTGRSPDCSFNSVKNRRWPQGIEGDPAIAEAGRMGRSKIALHPISFLWFSMVDIIELHLPYVGGGWSTRFNIFVAITQLVTLLGCVCGLRSIVDRRTWIFWILIIYNTGVFALTDATPRYLIPVFFCYAVIAAIGYHRILIRLTR